MCLRCAIRADCIDWQVSRLYRQPGARKFGRGLVFIGASGGAGSSTIAHNVACLIGRMHDCNVILLDLDLPFGTASLGFDLNATQGIAQALKDGNRFDDVLLERLLTKRDDHLQVLTAPATLEQGHDVEHGSFERLIETAQSNAPFVVMDVPHLWSSWARKTILAADDVVITAQPNLASLRNTKSLLDLLREARPNDSAPKIVLNQVGMPKRAEITPRQFADALQVQSILCVPFDAANMSAAANNGQMVVDMSMRLPVCTSLLKIAQSAAGPGAKPGPTGVLRWRRMVGSWLSRARQIEPRPSAKQAFVS